MDKKPLIVGVDPGSTSAVAAVNLEGEIELLESGKNFPPRDIIQRIIKVGKPVVTASDKQKTPSKVEKISSSLGTKLFEPEKDLSQKRKKSIGKGANNHELDAVASAIHAYKNLSNRIRKIENLNEEKEMEKTVIADKVFQEKPVKQIETSEETKTNKEKTRKQESLSRTDEEKQRLKRKIENLEDQVQKLKSKLGEKEKKNKDLTEKLESLREKERKEIRTKEIVQKKEAEIKKLEEDIQELEEERKDFKVREKQYRNALQKIYLDDYQLIPFVDEKIEEVPEKAVTRDKELIKVLEQKGCNIYHAQKVDGIELKNYFAVESFPEPKNFETIIKNYRESR